MILAVALAISAAIGAISTVTDPADATFPSPAWPAEPGEHAIAPDDGYTTCDGVLGKLLQPGQAAASRSYNASPRWGRVFRATMTDPELGSRPATFFTCWVDPDGHFQVKADAASPWVTPSRP
jgi:hypothetical protein